MSNFIDKSEYGSALAGEDLSAVIYRFLKLSSTGLVATLCDAITDKSIGVQQDKVESGQPVPFKRYGQSLVTAEEALAVGDIVAPSTTGRAQVAVSTQYARGMVVSPATGAGKLAVIELFTSAEQFLTPTTLTLTAGAAAAVAALRLGQTATEGWELKVLDEDVVIPSAVASVDLTEDIPDGAVILGCQMNLETIVTATTAVKVGLGIAANPDLYGITASLLKNVKTNLIPDWAVLSGAEDILIYAVDTGGSAAGTIDTGTVRVRIVYLALNGLDDAA